MAHRQNTERVGLVSGLDVSGYGIARSLGRAGVGAHALCSPKNQYGRFSRFCDGWFTYPPAPEDHLEQVCDLLLEVRGQFNSPPVLFATSDWFTRVLCSSQDRLTGHYLYHWLPRPLLETIVNKARLAEWCLHADITIPHTHITQPGEDLLAAALEFPYPCLVKPTLRTNPFFRETKNFLATSPTALMDLYARHPELVGTTIWQHYIPGGDENIFQCTALVRCNGEIGGLVTVRKLTQFPANGMMCFGRTEDHPVLEQAACRLLERLDYRGLASIEFKYSPLDGRFYFIEINARLPWYSSLFAHAGVNLPALAFDDLAGEPAPSPLPLPREGVYWMCVENTAKAVLSTEDRLARPWLRFLADVCVTQSFAWWDWRDPLPFLASAVHLLWRAVKKLNPFLHPATLPVSALTPATAPSAPSDSREVLSKPVHRQD